MRKFGFFQMRRLRRTMATSCSAILRIQFMLSQSSPADNRNDPWVLGYVYGGATAVLDRMGVEPSDQAYKLLEGGYAAIFGESRLGSQILERSMDLRSDPNFSEGQQVGGNEVQQLAAGKPAAFGLGIYLSEQGSSSVRQRLRQRWGVA